MQNKVPGPNEASHCRGNNCQVEEVKITFMSHSTNAKTVCVVGEEP